MICPMMSRTALLSSRGKAAEVKCRKEECAWWSDRFGMCCQAVDAYQRGVEDYRLEVKAFRDR